jgi:hypothetical protein
VLRGAGGRRDLVPGNHHPAHDRQGGERFLRIGSLHRQYFRAAPEACGIGCSKPKVAPWSPAASPNTFAKRGSAPPTVQCRPRRDRLTGPGHREAPLLLRVLRRLERSLVASPGFSLAFLLLGSWLGPLPTDWPYRSKAPERMPAVKTRPCAPPRFRRGGHRGRRSKCGTPRIGHHEHTCPQLEPEGSSNFL